MARSSEISLPFYVDPGDAPGKQQIMIHALRLFAEKGLSGTSIRDIADATGYTNPALYKHFAGKDELGAQLFRICYREIFRRMEAALSTTQDFEAALRAVVSSFCSLADDAPEAVVFAHAELQSSFGSLPARERKRTIAHLAVELIQRARSERLLRKSGGDAVRVAAVTGTLVILTRLVWNQGIPGPTSRWEKDLLATLRRVIVG